MIGNGNVVMEIGGVKYYGRNTITASGLIRMRNALISSASAIDSDSEIWADGAKLGDLDNGYPLKALASDPLGGSAARPLTYRASIRLASDLAFNNLYLRETNNLLSIARASLRDVEGDAPPARIESGTRIIIVWTLSVNAGLVATEVPNRTATRAPIQFIEDSYVGLANRIAGLEAASKVELKFGALIHQVLIGHLIN